MGYPVHARKDRFRVEFERCRMMRIGRMRMNEKRRVTGYDDQLEQKTGRLGLRVTRAYISWNSSLRALLQLSYWVILPAIDPVEQERSG